MKSLVVRRGEDDYLFVLVPGGRKISWPELRAELGVSRVSLPDREDAFARTGYQPGTITPFGSTSAWPVVADETLRGQEVTLGAGANGVVALLLADDAVTALDGRYADVTDPDS